MRHYLFFFISVLAWSAAQLQAEPQVFDLWPEDGIPGPAAVVDGNERDLTKALRLYERLGFVRLGDTGVYYLMEWRPGDQASLTSSATDRGE